MEKPLIINGSNLDLSDILRIARAEGRKVLNCARVNVKPLCIPYNDAYLVVVSPQHNGDGRSKSIGVDRRKHATKSETL